jgi:hypothetical protein
MRYPSDPADLRIGSPEWRRFMVQEVGMREAWLDFAASGDNLPFELADWQGRFDDMMQMLGGGKGADERQKQMREYLLYHMRMTRVWCAGRGRSNSISHLLQSTELLLVQSSNPVQWGMLDVTVVTYAIDLLHPYTPEARFRPSESWKIFFS